MHAENANASIATMSLRAFICVCEYCSRSTACACMRTRVRTKRTPFKEHQIIYLFNSLVLPVLEYGGVIWGNRIFTVIERVHLRFCKFVLGVPTSACNLACYGELGHYPVEIRIKISLIKFWLRLATDWSIPPLLYDAYQLSLSTPGSWCARIKQILDVSGFSFVWINPNKVDQSSFIEELSERLSCQYH